MRVEGKRLRRVVQRAAAVRLRLAFFAQPLGRLSSREAPGMPAGWNENCSAYPLPAPRCGERSSSDQPDAAGYLKGPMTLRGKTAQEVVQYMAQHGLQFVPAGPGDEAAYVALQRALAAYADRAAPSLASERER
jgi:hypothetical protein